VATAKYEQDRWSGFTGRCNEYAASFNWERNDCGVERRCAVQAAIKPTERAISQRLKGRASANEEVLLEAEEIQRIP
jgi:hypothetical protein